MPFLNSGRSATNVRVHSLLHLKLLSPIFLQAVASGRQRPQSALANATAAISNLYKACGLVDLTASMDIRMFASKALVKAYSTVPMSRSSVMPVSAFTSMYMAWADDDKLSVKDLRLKALTLLALALMLRPSDVAPRGQVLNPSTNKPESLLFTTDNVTFMDNGSAQIRFLGIKNDTARKGLRSHCLQLNLLRLILCWC